MSTCAETAPEQTGSYRSPWRVLARAFEKSRDGWKAKYKGLQERIKALRTELRDLRRSRDRWRAEADTLKLRLNELHTQVQLLTEQSPPAVNRQQLQRSTKPLS
jgi:predicted nuclease with TOPRIM domain